MKSPYCRQCKPLDRNSCGNIKHSFSGQRTFVFLSRVFGATTVFNSESFLFWRFSFRYGFRLDTDFKIETPALPTHIEQYSFIDY